jgi:flagellin-specific chaperone FliS
LDYEHLKESTEKLQDLYNYYKYNIAKVNNKDRMLELSIKWKNPVKINQSELIPRNF